MTRLVYVWYHEQMFLTQNHSGSRDSDKTTTISGILTHHDFDKSTVISNIHLKRNKDNMIWNTLSTMKVSSPFTSTSRLQKPSSIIT